MAYQALRTAITEAFPRMLGQHLNAMRIVALSAAMVCSGIFAENTPAATPAPVQPPQPASTPLTVPTPLPIALPSQSPIAVPSASAALPSPGAAVSPEQSPSPSPTPAHAAPSPLPTPQSFKQYAVTASKITFYYDLYLLGADNRVRVQLPDGGVVTGDTFAMNIKLNRFIVAGNVEIKDRGVDIHAAAFARFFSPAVRSYVIPITDEPDRWTFEGDDLTTPYKGRQMPGDAFFLPDLTKATPFIIGTKALDRSQRKLAHDARHRRARAGKDSVAGLLRQSFTERELRAELAGRRGIRRTLSVRGRHAGAFNAARPLRSAQQAVPIVRAAARRDRHTRTSARRSTR